MAIRTCDVTIFASFFRLIGSGVIFAIIDSVAHLAIRDAPMVFASEFSGSTIFVITFLFISAISAVILVVAFPSAENTTAIGTSELGRFASVGGTVVLVFVRVVSTIIIAVACPQSGDAFSVAANKLVIGRTQHSATGHCRGVDALLAIIDGREAVGTPAKSLAIFSRMAGISAASVIEFANVHSARLTFGCIDLDSPRRIIKPLDNFNQMCTGVLISSVDTSEL